MFLVIKLIKFKTILNEQNLLSATWGTSIKSKTEDNGRVRSWELASSLLKQ